MAMMLVVSATFPCQILLRLGLKAALTTGAAEVIHLPFVLRAVHRRGNVHRHVADRVNCFHCLVYTSVMSHVLCVVFMMCVMMVMRHLMLLVRFFLRTGE